MWDGSVAEASRRREMRMKRKLEQPETAPQAQPDPKQQKTEETLQVSVALASPLNWFV